MSLLRLTALLVFVSTGSAIASCPLPGEVAHVPEGYRYPLKNKWLACVDGQWTESGPVMKSRPYTDDNTGSCLPLDKQFVKKNGMISMNFVPEKTERKFYGKKHECVAGNWWQLEEGTPPPATRKTAPAANPEPPEKIQSIVDKLEALDETTEASPVMEPAAQAVDPEPKKAPEPEVPLSFNATIEPPEKKPEPAKSQRETLSPTPDAPKAQQFNRDYKTCRQHCSEGMDQRLKASREACRNQVVQKYGKGDWPKEWVNTFNRCRAAAARAEKVRMMKCLRPCKKQAGHYIWEGN